MFLVILALGVGVVLAGVALSTRSTAPQIGANVHEMSAAQWVAESAARYAEAVLQTSAEWRASLGADGLLVADLEIGPGLADITVRSADGSPLKAAEREILIISTGRVGSMSARVERTLSLTPSIPIEQAVSLELPEFAVVAGNMIRIEESAAVSAYPYSPDAATPYPVRLAAFFVSSGALDIAEKALLTNTAITLDTRASTALSTAADSRRFAEKIALPFSMPFLVEQLPSWMTGLPIMGLLDTTISGSTYTFPDGGARRSLTVSTGGTAVIDASRGDKYSFDSLTIQNGGVLRIKGRVYIHVKGSMTMSSRGRVEYADNASSVVFFTGGNVTIDDAVIGLGSTIASNSSRSVSDVKTYTAPARCRLLALGTASGGILTPIYRVSGRAIVVASLHNPAGEVEIREDSAVIGRAMARDFRLRTRATLWYDPAMDSRAGYSCLNGPLYAEGALLPCITATMAGFKNATGCSNASAILADAVITALTTDPKWIPLVTNDDTGSGGLLAPVISATTTTLGGVLDPLLGDDGKTEADDDPLEPASIVTMNERSARSAIKTRTERVPALAKKLEDSN